MDSTREKDENGLHVLGKGGFGSVVFGLWRGKKVAVKVLRGETMKSELNASDFVHQNVVRVLSSSVREKNGNAVVIMEFAGKSNLLTLIRKHSEIVDSEFQLRCFSDVASGLSYVHSKDVVHLDVKPANVIVNSKGQCKIGDFGCSRKRGERDESNCAKMMGTSGYQAPEYLREGIVDAKCDVYAFGVLMWSAVAKESPFEGEHPHTIIFKVGKTRSSGSNML